MKRGILILIVLTFLAISLVANVSAQQAECTDSDSGKNYYTKGTTMGLAADGILTTRVDSCWPSNYYGDGYDYVAEWFCWNNSEDGKTYAINTNEKCIFGCQDGACLSVPTKCTDSDGKSYYVKGRVISPDILAGYNYSSNDHCVGDDLYEGYCIDSVHSADEIKYCDFGCKDGACLSGLAICTDSDGGLAPNIYGEIYINGQFVTKDECLSSNVLDECQCAGGSQQCVTIACPNGCKDGTCISSKSNECSDVYAYSCRNQCFANEEQVTYQCISGVCCKPQGVIISCIGVSDCQKKECNAEYVTDNSGRMGRCEYQTELICNDGFDNDADGLTDFSDSDCSQTCEDKGGEICPSDETCLGDLVNAFDTAECCLGECGNQSNKCIPEWECKIEPLICPPEGIQTTICKDVKCDTGTKEAEISCTSGKCSGCLYDDSCLSFGQRLKINETASFCDVTKEFKPQKEKEVECQNDYECLSNDCKDGKCVSTYSLLQAILEFIKKLFGG